jgi:hypothetical protein
MVIDVHVECGQEGIEVFRHKSTSIPSATSKLESAHAPAGLGITHLVSCAGNSAN